jgi:hypothetical protein
VRNTAFIGDVEVACTDSVSIEPVRDVEVDDSIDVVVKTELRIDYGMLHTGYADVGGAKDARQIPVVVKLAFEQWDKETLAKEFNIYAYLHASGVRGIPHCFGYFIDDSLIEGCAGPHALVLSRVGGNISHRINKIPRLVKYVLVPHSPFILH